MENTYAEILKFFQAKKFQLLTKHRQIKAKLEEDIKRMRTEVHQQIASDNSRHSKE